MGITQEEGKLEEDEHIGPMPSLVKSGFYKSCGSIDRLSYLLKDKPISDGSLVKSQSVSTLNESVASDRIAMRETSTDLHSLQLGGLRNNPNTAWIFAVPSKVTKHKACDEVSEDFRKAGIGSCFKG